MPANLFVCTDILKFISNNDYNYIRTNFNSSEEHIALVTCVLSSLSILVTKDEGLKKTWKKEIDKVILNTPHVEPYVKNLFDTNNLLKTFPDVNHKFKFYFNER